MNEFPLVSIIIPTYNSAHTILETIDACLNQSYPNIEVIVIDDGSTDDTKSIVLDAYGDQLRYIYQENAGPANARNNGIREAAGEFIQFCDSDDLLLPEKVEKSVEILLSNPQLALVYSRFETIDQTGQILDRPAPPILTGDDVYCQMLRANGSPFQTSTTTIRKSVLLDVGLFREVAGYHCAEDWELFLRIASQYPIYGIDEVLVQYRGDSEGLTSNVYCMAFGRLLTLQFARDYPGREGCIDNTEYDRMLADRYHVLAMVDWAQGRRNKARESFDEAIRLDPEHARVRQLYSWFSYVFPASSTKWLANIRSLFGN